MKITERQRMLINKLDQVVYRRKASGMRGYFLGIDDCTSTINSLLVKGLIRRSHDQKVLCRTDLTSRTSGTSKLTHNPGLDAMEHRAEMLRRRRRAEIAVAESQELIRRAARTMAGNDCVYEPWPESGRDIERRRHLAAIDGSIHRLFDRDAPTLSRA